MKRLLLNLTFFFIFIQLYSQGNVGIGTLTPNGTLHLYGTGSLGGGSRLVFGDDIASANRTFVAEYNWLTNSDSDALEVRGEQGIYFTRGTSSTPTISGSFDVNGIFRLFNVNTDVTASNVLVRLGDGSIAQRGISSLLQVTTEDITNQRVGIRTTTPEFTFDIVHKNGTPAPGSADPHNGLNIRHEGTNNENWTLYVSNADGDLEFYNQGVKEVEFTDDGAINILSDERAKYNIKNLDTALPLLSQLSPKTYQYKHSRSGKTSYGFLAQEVEKIFPDFVKKGGDNVNDNGYTLNYFSFIPVLIKAVQEQQNQIQSKDAEIIKLKLQNISILERLEKLEKMIGKKG